MTVRFRVTGHPFSFWRRFAMVGKNSQAWNGCVRDWTGDDRGDVEIGIEALAVRFIGI